MRKELLLDRETYMNNPRHKKFAEEAKKHRRDEFWREIGVLLYAMAAAVPVAFLLACLAVLAVGG